MSNQKKGQKVGRNKKGGQNARYINEQRADKSHIRKIVKHLKRFPGDAVAQTALQEYQIKTGTFRRAK